MDGAKQLIKNRIRVNIFNRTVDEFLTDDINFNTSDTDQTNLTNLVTTR